MSTARDERGAGMSTPHAYPRWMSTDSAARYLDRSPQALRQLVARGLITSHLVRGRRVFGRDELDQWVLTGGKVSPPLMEERRSM